VHYRDVHRGDIIVFLKPNPRDAGPGAGLKRAIGIPGDKIHLEHGVVYLNGGVAQNEPYAALPRDDGKPEQMYQPADDFPRFGTPPGAPRCGSQDEPSHVEGPDIVCRGQGFCHGRQPRGLAERRFWGLCRGRTSWGGRCSTTVLPDSEPTDAEMTRDRDRIGSFFDTALHFFTRTRWSRTLHPIK